MDNQTPHRIPWIAIVFAILAVLAFFKASDGSFRYGVMPMMDVSRVDFAEMDVSYPMPAPMPPTSAQGSARFMSDAMIAPGMPYPYPGYSQPDADDTREFLKVSYGAQMQTRDVPALTRRVEGTVRSHDGRIDGTSSSREYGYVSFIVPMSKYETFRNDLESLVGSRFLQVNISSENLLPQKVSIEEQQEYVESSLADLRAERARIVSAHSRNVATIQSQINANTQEISQLNAERPTDPNRQAQIAARLQALYSSQNSLNARLASENKNYSSDLDDVDYEISYAEKSLDAVKEQDQDLLDSVATVNGHVSITWIGLYEIAELYLPGYWIPGIFAALSAISYYLNRRRVWIF